MSEYKAIVTWNRRNAVFTDNRYSRTHQWAFDGGLEIPASASPQVVRPPLSDPAAVDPEEAFVASLSSCHMLFFLSIAAKRGFVAESYRDEAVGIMSKDSEGRIAMTRVTLHPEVSYSGGRLPSKEESDAMHHEAHEQCYIANSVKTDIRCEPE
jgi:organic hydroperoxide reductase OsmC/OhrA